MSGVRIPADCTQTILARRALQAARGFSHARPIVFPLALPMGSLYDEWGSVRNITMGIKLTTCAEGLQTSLASDAFTHSWRHQYEVLVPQFLAQIRGARLVQESG